MHLRIARKNALGRTQAGEKRLLEKRHLKRKKLEKRNYDTQI